MEAENRRSKGGFLQLFDWNAKSRKKLFSNRPDVPESSKQGKENVDNLAISRLQQIKLDESMHGPSLSGNDWASSTSTDEGSGSKAPGVVARLMGLDSLPTLDASVHGFTSHVYPNSFSHSLRPGITTESETITEYGMRNKVDGFSRNPVEDKLQKLQHRPIEKFQSEVLPPRSAKSVPITHHRMLSPIKSPGYVLSRDVAFIMEEASKIIEQNPQPTLTGRLPSSRSSSVPLRIRDLKQKMEAAHRSSRLPESSQRPKTCSPVNFTKRESRSEVVVLKHGATGSLNNKNKSATPGKTNIQILEGSTSRKSRSIIKQKEDDAKSVQLDKKQRNTPKRVQSRSTTGKTAEVLKQNDQKQNCASHKDQTSLKPRVPYQHGRKTSATNVEFKPSKKVVENSPRKAQLVTSESLSRTKNFSGKRPNDGDIISDRSATNDALIKEKERSVKCNITIDGSSNWDMKNGMDVVSFTFTSPIKKSESDSGSCSQSAMKSRCLFQENTGTSPVIDSDALSVLLEQKLKELSSLASGDHLHKDKSIVEHDSDVSLVDQLLVNSRMEWQGVEVTECSENYESTVKLEDQHEHPSTSASLEHSLSDDSCITSNSTTTLTSNGNKQFMSAANMELLAEERELQDSATSNSSTISESTFMERWSSQHELEYIKEMLNHAELVLHDFAYGPFGNAQKVISVDLFDQLENQNKNMDPYSKQQRKASFDCVSVCLESRREHGSSGSYEEWSKWSTLLQKTDLLADEIQKEIRGWTSMEELMVDEVVEKDMSCGNGKWLDFEAEALEEAVVIETYVLITLIDEIVVDFLSC